MILNEFFQRISGLINLVLLWYMKLTVKTRLVFFTTGRYASDAVVMCLSVRLSQAGTVPKGLNAGSRKQRHPYDSPWTLVFWCQRSGRNSNGVNPNGGAKYRWGRLKSAILDQYLAMSQKWCKIER